MVADLFRPTGSIIELILRGSLMYLAIFVLLRVVLKRRSEGVSIPDVLLVVLVADAAQNGMAGEYRSITEGLVLVATILFWNAVLDWMAYLSPHLEKLITPDPLLLIENGRLCADNMRHELITRSELMSMLRELGIDDISVVTRAHLEPNGKLSVAPRPKA